VSATFERGSSRGFGEILRELANGGANLLRAEVKLARLELGDVMRGVSKGTALVAIGGVLLLLGGLSLATGIVLVVGDQWLPRDRFWLAALAVLVVTGAIAALFARRGLTQLSPSHLAPDETVETLKEDKEWLKRQLTSGATSK
jgi:uncharacterized membrane protein YqjE